MSSVAGYGPNSFQASAAVYNISAIDKAPSKTRDDYVAPVETTNRQATKSDISFLKMNDPSLGQNVDFKV
jgi:hypothetical protein